MVKLAAYAASTVDSQGRIYPEAEADYRTAFQRDRDRIVHSSAFRRLEYKTQVFINHEGDMFRTRLTHSIEVAQIARTIARSLALNEDLIEAIALAHDLGHTPFGHAGQDALHKCMQDFGGFEHNLQSLRIVDKLEQRYAEFSGLNLTFEVREGIIKHCSRQNAKMLGAVGQRFLKPKRTQPSLEAQLANVADEIAYNNHDIDDGLRSGLINFAQLTECTLFNECYTYVSERWPDLAEHKIRHEVNRRMITAQVRDLIEQSSALINSHEPNSIDDVRSSSKAFIRLSESMQKQNIELKQFLRRKLYQHDRVQIMSQKAAQIIEGLFAVYMHDPATVPHLQTYLDINIARQIADYIAGMTDRFAIAEYQRIVGKIDMGNSFYSG